MEEIKRLFETNR